MAGKFVSYLRVSTKRQGDSGLGLEAQQAAILDFLNGGAWELVGEFVEVESGKRQDNRPKLQEALQLAKATGAKLLIAKLDRLSRNAAFLLSLRDAGVDFVCVDNPQATPLTIGILAVVAQDERERISARTKAALAAAKARGVRLGCPNGAAHLKGRGNMEAVAAIRQSAQDRAEGLRQIVAGLWAEGPTLQKLADQLNARGILTPRGGQWHPASVGRLLKRLGLVEA
jgi:DNA invertase Pin-like site-specific DNA recombinase